MKFYRMVGHNPGTKRLDFQCPRRKVKIVRGKKAKIVFLWVTPFKIVVEWRDKK